MRACLRNTDCLLALYEWLAVVVGCIDPGNVESFHSRVEVTISYGYP
jgi:hypothetical protein